MAVMAAELVVVTGAGAGIGRALAGVFSAAGHPCLLISRHLETHPELEGQPVLYRELDVSDADELGGRDHGCRKPVRTYGMPYQ